jgi:exodeoxyribonuclease VII large subunit
MQVNQIEPFVRSPTSPDPETIPTLTVAQLNREVRQLLETHFDYVWVSGELSNFARPSSGHWYFTLKDGEAQVRCAMFRNRNQRIRFAPDSGDAVRLRARVSLYEGRGEFQLIVEFMEPAGAGALQARFEALRERLRAEGLFDTARKQPLPDRISRVGVVTSASGAALHDILTVLARRSPATEVLIFPTLVQGNAAPAAIAEAIGRANRWRDTDAGGVDVLIVGRGGGSLEVLWAFNEEVVARAIAASDLPVISAVGHEVDVSIADFVADQRAPTPSAAAELVSRDREMDAGRARDLHERLQAAMHRRLAAARRELAQLNVRMRHPGARLRERAQYLDGLESRLTQALRVQLKQRRQAIDTLRQRLYRASPAQDLQRHRTALDGLSRGLSGAMRRRLIQARETVSRRAELLDSLSPLAILGRGYAILSNAQGDILRRSGQARVGDALEARLADGRISATVTGVHPEEGD